MRTLIIGNKNYSSWSLRPWLFLRKNKLAFEEQVLWLDEAAFKTQIKAIGSGGKVPVLIDQGDTIWDSLSIIESVIDRYDCAYGWPENIALRAHARSISYEMHSSFMALRQQCPMDVRSKHQLTLKQETQKDIARVVENLTQALESSKSTGNWLYGDFSVADAMYAPVVFRLSGYAVDVPKLIQNYINHVLEDASIKEWVQSARTETHSKELHLE